MLHHWGWGEGRGKLPQTRKGSCGYRLHPDEWKELHMSSGVRLPMCVVFPNSA